MRKQIAVLASALLLGGGVYAQNALQTQKPKAYMVSDAHLDTQWNWDIQTTIKDYVWNTISQNLFLLKQYPEYIFNFEGGVKYAQADEASVGIQFKRRGTAESCFHSFHRR